MYLILESMYVSSQKLADMYSWYTCTHSSKSYVMYSVLLSLTTVQVKQNNDNKIQRVELLCSSFSGCLWAHVWMLVTVGFEEDAYQIVSIEELFIMVRSLSTNGFAWIERSELFWSGFFFFFVLYWDAQHPHRNNWLDHLDEGPIWPTKWTTVEQSQFVVG